MNLLELFIAFAVLLVSLTFHESAHAWTADRLGDPTARLLGRVSLNPAVHADPIGTVLFPLIAFTTGAPIIGWAKPVPVNISNLRRQRRDFVLVAAAGPASNLVLAVGASLVLHLLEAPGLALLTPASSFLDSMLHVNILLAVFNMVPIPPLDGGNVLAGLLPRGAAVTFDRLRPFGFLILYGLMLTGMLYVLIAPPYRLLLSWLL
ncbi:MAG: site-2 protease family protein [Acidobacteria bacterium]|nr:site-2 protease family protein [Acidobacteriota bacterium]MBI3265013.1 site-2 protease family protein [Acidobacteriota bacterium]